MPSLPKVALVTGAARRIGAAIARILHENQYCVVIHYNQSQKEAEQLSSAFNNQRKNSACSVRADVRNFEQLKPLIDKTISQWGQLDLLVNNASCFFKTPVGQVTETDWDTLMDTHIKAPFFLAEAAYPHLAKQRGAIVNISDIYANRSLRDYPVYSISKAGLLMVTKTLAKEFGPKVRVNSVSPGAILWPEAHNALSDEMKQKITQKTALQCHGDPKEIAKTVLFLARDAEYMTGQDLAVDGGRLLMI